MSASNTQKNEDLDVFLTTIESKLRGPFSSLDLAKAVTAAALRGSLTPPQYLQNLNQVLLRTDKVTQLRILVGLLGLDPDPAVDQEIFSILQRAQHDSDEDWIQIIAGFIQGIIFKDEEDSRESCRGPAAQELLKKTCDDICDRVNAQIAKQLENPPDLNAYFVPYRYSLVDKSLQRKANGNLEDSNPHFKVNLNANILKIDKQLEAQRAKEAQELTPIRMRQTKRPGASTAAAKPRSNLPPGYKPTVLVKPTKSKPSSSMFAPRPNTSAQKAQLANRSKLMRRKGGAQSLVSGTIYKHKSAAKAAAGQGKIARAGNTGRVGRFSSGKSKMKMLDVDAVSNLHQETAQRKKEEAIRKLPKKRRLVEAAAQALKKTKTEEPQTGAEAASSEPKQPPEAAAPAAPQGPTSSAPQAVPQAVPQAATQAVPQAATQQQEWKILLNERSNKLSDSDRARIQQFFENQYNPTPDQPMYKMKLHEQRTIDPATGKNIKETFYLELDYEKQTSKQSKKTKRY